MCTNSSKMGFEFFASLTGPFSTFDGAFQYSGGGGTGVTKGRKRNDLYIDYATSRVITPSNPVQRISKGTVFVKPVEAEGRSISSTLRWFSRSMASLSNAVIRMAKLTTVSDSPMRSPYKAINVD